MSTQAGGLYLLKRVAARAGLGVWRNRGGVMLAALFTAGVGTYAGLTWNGMLPTALAAGAPTAVANTDCADTAIAAVADKSAAASQRAYLCMDTTVQQRMTEADFVRQMQAQKLPNISKLARVGDYRSASGGTMVYYALDGASGQSVGYIVYVAKNGKVLRIE
ncbi:MAG TPA: hypothetical protein VGE94_18615 [Chloroflexota bacterium]|jgi:hypothetical protein